MIGAAMVLRHRETSSNRPRCTFDTGGMVPAGHRGLESPLRHSVFAARLEVLTHSHDGDTDESKLGIEEKMMALGRLLEVDRFAGVA